MHLREVARKAAQHEMGHYVVARLLGFQTGSVSLEITGVVDGHQGQTELLLAEPISTLEEVKGYLRRRVQVLYAGAPAETLPARQSPTKQVDVEDAVKIIRSSGRGAEQDYAKARELIRLLRNVEHPSHTVSENATNQQLSAIDIELWNNAVGLVQKHADLIIGLAGNLTDRVQGIKQRVVLDAAYHESLPAVKELVPIR